MDSYVKDRNGISRPSGCRVLGGYRILKKIGSGGMGNVFRALNEKDGAVYALKTFVVDKLTEANKVRLKREAQALSRFNHPNIVKFFGLHTEERFFYYIMEYIDGESLSNMIERVCRIDKESIPLPVVLNIAYGVASALRHAHSHNVLHRDVKPDNILIAKDGRCVLSDFGLAKLKDMLSVTKAGQVLGTVAYFSPEQMQGTVRIDELTDVYQYGLTLYEILTGQLPFGEEKPLNAMKRRIRDPIPAPSLYHDECPVFLDEIVLKCLSRKREDRYSSMAEVLKAFKKADRSTAGGGAAVAEPGAKEAAPPGAKGKAGIVGKAAPSLYIIIGLCVCLAVIFAIVLGWFL